MAQHTISPEELAALDDSCEVFDQEVSSRLNVSELKALAASLAQRYPADSAQLAVYGGCGSCDAAA